MTEPAAVREVLRHLENDESASGRYHGGQQHRALHRVLGGNMVLTAGAEAHHRLKKFAMRGLFGKPRAKEQCASHHALVEEWLLALPHEAEWSGVDLAKEIVVPLLHRYLFGEGRIPERTMECILQLERKVEELALYKLRLPFALDASYQEAAEEINELIDRLISEGAQQDGLIGEMLRAENSEGEQLFSMEEVRDMARMVLFVGQGTTSRTLGALFYYLACYPEWQELIAEEVNQVRWEKGVGRFTRVQQVLKETLRLSGPVWSQARTVSRPLSLAGERVAPGTMVITSQYLTNHDGARWDNPDRFDPYRFEEGGERLKGFYPFGQGPNVCMGQFVARELMITVAALVASSARLELVDPASEPGERAGLFLEHHPVPRVRVRTKIEREYS